MILLEALGDLLLELADGAAVAAVPFWMEAIERGWAKGKDRRIRWNWDPRVLEVKIEVLRFGRWRLIPHGSFVIFLEDRLWIDTLTMYLPALLAKYDENQQAT